MAGDINRKRILVVAGDETVRHFCRASLAPDLYHVELVSGMHEALGSLRSVPYDLVISDIEVPKLDGIDLYIIILKKYPYLKNRFLFIIGDCSTDLPSFLSYVQIGYLAKPIKISELIEAVGKAAAERPMTPGSSSRDRSL
ncbi:MAG: response regulator [Deltaproteobacteria bacterium]|nr:response regulator [Deltaproteobacteria bacterium]